MFGSSRMIAAVIMSKTTKDRLILLTNITVMYKRLAGPCQDVNPGLPMNYSKG